MAAVVSHAMRRFSSTPPDNAYSYGLRPKSEEGESALSRSMRYADPWLYGSVRAPSGNFVLTPAFVLCSCPDYINGTKRSAKKSPSTCKKCKGTRLPLNDSKFGTVRCYPTSNSAPTTPLRAGTLRVMSSASRPSILPANDPYDLMRRSRLTVADSGSQFRARSVSPGQNKAPRPGTIGRRSILECDINPYELMAGERDITTVNGQRIRVRAKTEVLVVKQPKVQNEKESESGNRFKSILKKRATTFSDTDSDGPELNPSPALKSGSHFYLPMPGGGGAVIRKKVQFLVENNEDETTRGDNADEPEIACYDANVEDVGEKVQEDEEEKAGEADKAAPKDEVKPLDGIKVCTLRRSASECGSHDSPQKVFFHDTMALRTRTPRPDARITFGDLQRLDGLIKKPSTKPRPTRPPPPPPPPTEEKHQKTPEPKDDPPPSAPPRKRSNNKPLPPTTTTSSPNKTIVQISAAQTVHKLQIKNDFNNIQTVSISDNPQRKTSIMITGDDCYSTMNVNDDIPLYQSSVVVNDNPDVHVLKSCNEKRASCVYITGNFAAPPPADPHLKALLNDPVEAVKRNLVPHVCGKPQAAAYEDVDLSSEHSSSTQYELMDASCSESYDRTKFYELLADSAIEVSEPDDHHHYESIKLQPDPIYEEIELPPPLPANPPPSALLDDLHLDKEYTSRSIFEGASKYDILSYLVDAKERGIVQEDSYTYTFPDKYRMSSASDSSEDNSLPTIDDKKTAEVERNDSGVGSETSKSSLSKYRTKGAANACEDCETPIESSENEPLMCRKCAKKRTERKEIITEIVETEEKYSRDLQVILEEFYQPMLVAGLLTPDQLAAIFLNAEELLENSQGLAERLRDAVEIAAEQGDEDLLTVNIGKLFLEAAPMLHGFETYCVRQGAASLLLASLEKEKELLRIFLRVSQMENAMLRRMNLNSFLMVPVQRVTKYPLLLARLYKVTPPQHETKEQLKEAQHKIELHLNHMNSETKDVPSKLWRRIGSGGGRRSSAEMDLVNIKLRKIAVDVLEWNHDEAKFALEGKLLFTQPTDNNWRKGRTIKLTPVNALLVINGKPGARGSDGLVFSRHSAVRDAALLLVRDKNGRYSLLREPLYLDRCVIAADPAWQSYFEVQELLGKDTFLFKAEDEEQTKLWYNQLQYHAQGMGAWRKRRNALANIMINGMGLRT